MGSPYEGIGLLQWSFGRSFDILREIYVALGNDWGGTTPPANIQTAIENNNRWTSHKWYQYADDTVWVRQFLDLPEARAIATTKKLEETQGYIDTINSQGVTDLRAAGFGADVGNQYGTGWGANFGMARYNSSHNSLDAIFNATPMTYYNRRKNVYDYLKTADFDNPAPVLYQVDETESPGAQDPVEDIPAIDNPEKLPTIIQEVYTRYANQYVYKSGNHWINDHMNIVPINPALKHVIFGIDLYTLDYEEIEQIANEIDEEEEEELAENAEDELSEITDLPEAIQKVINKANSYPDYSVEYSMYGARDMVNSGDCSCFVDICFRAAGLNIGGYTGAQYTTARNNGWIVAQGNRSIISSLSSQAKAGDYVLMEKSTSGQFGAGGDSHVVVMITDTTCRHQSSYYRATGGRSGPGNENLQDYLTYLNNFNTFALCRPFS